MTPQFHGHACAKCETVLKALPRVIGAWPEVLFCPNMDCERGGVLLVNPLEVPD